MGTVLIAVGAVVFGRLPALAYGWLAGLVGTTAIFLLVRSVARDYVQRTLDARTERLRALDERVTRNGFRTVLVLRLVFGLAPMLNWGLGLTGVRLPHYLAATALGIVPNLTVAVFFADTIVGGLPGSTPSSWVCGRRNACRRSDDRRGRAPPSQEAASAAARAAQPCSSASVLTRPRH
jgi:uncharacterized membrane protein YdjX (TVP38/TMEM64 family)